MKKITQEFLKKLLHPFAIGIYVSLTISYISFDFYVNRNKNYDSLDPFHQFLSTMDQKSIDFRLIARGPRKGSSEVALLTVDEKAVSSVGRWPWPRELIAKAYENAIKHGAKVIALDAVFSEPSAQPAQDVIAKVREVTTLPQNIDGIIDEELKKRDSDKILAETVANNADKIILGTFFDAEETFQKTPGHVDRCYDMIFKTTSAYDIWNNEEEFPIINDEYLPYIPDTLIQIYQQHFNSLAESVIEESPAPKNSQEFLERKINILNRQREYCRSFLDPETDELYEILAGSWGLVKEQEGLEEPSFDAWANNFRENSFQSTLSIADMWVMNTDLISAGAKHTAFFNAYQDPDGSIRRARLLIRTGTHYMPALAFKAFLLAKGLAPEMDLKYDPTLFKKAVNSLGFINSETGEKEGSLPVDRSGNLIINYAGPQKMFPYISMADMLNDSLTAPVEQLIFDDTLQHWVETKITVNKNDFLKDKILIFGATAKAIYDLRVTPFDENFPGAETHVNIVDNLLRNDFLFSSRQEEWQMPIFLLVLGVVLSLLISNLGAVSGILLTAFVLAGTIIIDQIYFFQQGLVIAIIFPMFLIGGLYVALTFYKYFTEERGKKELKQTFQKYVSPAVVDEILSDPENIELGGKKLRMTVFFSDVRGFTTISEKLDPRALSDLLNYYLTPMTELVFQNKGTLDKYMGDAIMAFFGAPIHYREHAKYGCRCALESLEKLKEIQEELKKKGLPMIDIGIGLNTGDMSVGNMGSETVRSYTVMGDAVNLGSRLEGINKQYGTRIIISEFTYEDVKDEFVCREIDLVRVKGKVLPVKIYELIAEKTVSKEMETVLNHFKKGYDLYHKKAFQEAIHEFDQALSINPEDQCSKLYIKRCEDFISTPPPENWDGVFVMTSK